MREQRYYDLDNLASHLIDAQKLATKLGISLSDLDNAIATCLEECEEIEARDVVILSNRFN